MQLLGIENCVYDQNEVEKSFQLVQTKHLFQHYFQDCLY